MLIYSEPTRYIVKQDVRYIPHIVEASELFIRDSGIHHLENIWRVNSLGWKGYIEVIIHIR